MAGIAAGLVMMGRGAGRGVGSETGLGRGEGIGGESARVKGPNMRPT